MSRETHSAYIVNHLLPFDKKNTLNLFASCSILWNRDKTLELFYRFNLKPDFNELNIKIPLASKIPLRKADLSLSTCFELFLSEPNNNYYWEMNFSPSGDWNLYFFDDYRKNMITVQNAEEPIMEFLSYDQGFNYKIIINLRPWFIYHSIPELSPAVVLESFEGKKTYWAFKHNSDKADFHNRSTFLVI